MTGTRVVFVGGSKGGVGKSSTSHLICLGAILSNQPASYVLTDPDRAMRGEGRPYSVLDGRQPAALANILSAARSTLNGWLVIDGGGNRPAFDAAIAAEVDLCLLPFRASEEDLDTVVADMCRLNNALAWPSAWPTNAKAFDAAQYYIDALASVFPGRVITPPIAFVNSVAELLAKALHAPSTPVRHLARKVFQVVEEQSERLPPPEAESPADRVA